MSTHTRDSMIADGTNPVDIGRVERIASDALRESGANFIVWEWKNAPELFRELCWHNGGDEDWLVLCLHIPYIPSWIDHMDSMNDPTVYELTNVTLIVASHA